MSKNHESLNLEIEILHEVELKLDNNSVKLAKVLITKVDKRVAVDNTNCPDTGASVTISGKHLMRKMGLTRENLLTNNTRVSAAERTSIMMWGFIPVKLRVKDQCGASSEMNKCLYFAERVLTMLVSLSALKNLGCVSQNFPYPETESASTLTDRDDRDKEEDEAEDVIKPRGPMPDKPAKIPFPQWRRTCQTLRPG